MSKVVVKNPPEALAVRVKFNPWCVRVALLAPFTTTAAVSRCEPVRRPGRLVVLNTRRMPVLGVFSATVWLVATVNDCAVVVKVVVVNEGTVVDVMAG